MATHHEATLKEKKDTSQVVDDEAAEPPVRLFQVTVKDDKAVRLTANADRIQAFYLSPDGKRVVAIHERSLRYTFDQQVKPAVLLHDLQTARSTPIFQGQQFHIADIHWRPDSKGFFAVNQFTTHPRYLMAYVEELYEFDLARGEAAPVPLDWEKGLADGGDGLAVTPDGFIALLADGARHRAARYRRDGSAWKRQWLEGEHTRNLLAVQLSRDGQMAVYRFSTASQPPRWFRARLQEDRLDGPVPLVDLNGGLAGKRRARAEIVRWKGALGEDVEGVLLYPHDFLEGQKRPLVVLIHGGPYGSDLDDWGESWAYAPNLLCARGAFVLRPNYHGSSHYGLRFAESIAGGKYYDLPVEDIEKGIDHLVARGLVDGTRVGLTGWSNGAILTMALITRRHYRAAAAGAGGSEWVADWGTCEFGLAFDHYYLGKSPLEDPQLYRRNAPWFDFPKVRTPTLLFHGSEDRVVPTHHGWMQYRALQQLGKTEVRFLLFPGEKHSLTKLAHQRRKLTEELAWFDQHLFEKVQHPRLALKEDSPLARSLALQKAAREGRRYGIQEKGILVPETVPHGKLDLGRFEVTRAQFAQFDKGYAVESGTENYPANGITFDQARAYCAWLSKSTGNKYRLGKRSELEKLYEGASGPENTLDHWAGYAVNPEDLARLQEETRALPGKAPLLKEVGGFPEAKEAKGIYDLGGNVAEWVEDAQGRGHLLGASADTAAEDRNRRPTADYIGFRVVKER
jgi:dipeptidyl aminopeptidase/acylaminoacyl peptidase